MRQMIVVVAVLSAAVFTAVPAAAQIQSRPTDPPIVTADNDSWFQRGDPVQFAGELYYPAVAAVFFNGNSMVRSGQYNGVPLYTDTTIEPFSIVYVPVSRGLLQPYEKPRRGALAGTTGSRTPSFPGRLTPESAPVRPGPIATSTASVPAAARDSRSGIPGAVGTSGIAAAVPATPRAVAPMVTLRRPSSNDGVWVDFGGEKWVSAGPAIPFAASAFVQVGEHAGFAVFARRELQEEMIYLPTRPGIVAPYRLKD